MELDEIFGELQELKGETIVGIHKGPYDSVQIETKLSGYIVIDCVGGKLNLRLERVI